MHGSIRTCHLLGLGLVGLLGCGGPRVPDQPDARATSISRGNLDAEDFKRALVGNWVSVWRDVSRCNVDRLVMNADGTASLTVSQGESREEHSGRWEVSFERTPDPGMITFGSIRIVGDGKTVTLARVNFGHHNGVIMTAGPFLRMDQEPFGVLKKVSDSSVLNAETFLRIKAQVLAKGDRLTYCNMYNKNPHLALRDMDVFLNPDTGQGNINCDLKLSDFNQMIIRTKGPNYYDVMLPKKTNALALVVLQNGRGGPDVEADVEKLFENALAEIEASSRVFYGFRPPHPDDEPKSEYADGKPKRNILEAFIKSKSSPGDKAKEAEHVKVELLTLTHAQSCQRPFDLAIEGAGLEVFITYVKGGKVVFQPDYRSLVPITRIEQDLLELAKSLGVEKPSITRGMGWLGPTPTGRPG